MVSIGSAQHTLLVTSSHASSDQLDRCANSTDGMFLKGAISALSHNITLQMLENGSALLFCYNKVKNMT